MSESWDTIVIGAGIGGLSAAAHLVKAGLRVLILERNPHPGGTAYAYHRKRFTFPMGPLGFSHPHFVQEILQDLGVADDLKFSRVFYRMKAFDLDIPLSLPFPKMRKVLAKLFPIDAQSVEDFFKYAARLAATRKMLDSHHLQLNHGADISASEYLHRSIKDWRLRRILGSIGTREPYSGLPLLAAMWNLMCEEGIWYPEEGMEPFCKRLVRAVTRNDEHKLADPGKRKNKGVGEIQLHKEVVRIRVEKARILGVALKDGTEIDSTSIISNADYKTTFVKLLDFNIVPPVWYEAVANARQTASVFQVCLGVDAGKVNLSAFEEAGRLIYRSNVQEEEDLNWNALENLAGQELELSLWVRPERTPSSVEKASIVIRTEMEYNHFAEYRSGWRQRSPKYQDYKIQLAQTLVKEIEHLIPGLGKSILVMDVATPLTFEDQGGRSGGAVAGWSWDHEDFRDYQPQELIGTPIKGLYMAGYQAFSALFWGGVATAMESGKRAAKAVLQGTGPLETILIPGVK